MQADDAHDADNVVVDEVMMRMRMMMMVVVMMKIVGMCRRMFVPWSQLKELDIEFRSSGG